MPQHVVAASASGSPPGTLRKPWPPSAPTVPPRSCRVGERPRAARPGPPGQARARPHPGSGGRPRPRPAAGHPGAGGRDDRAVPGRHPGVCLISEHMGELTKSGPGLSLVFRSQDGPAWSDRRRSGPQRRCMHIRGDLPIRATSIRFRRRRPPQTSWVAEGAHRRSPETLRLCHARLLSIPKPARTQKG